MNPKFKALFQPFTFPNGVTINNRIVMSPMTTFSGFENGKYTLDELNYYQARAKNLGMIIVGCSYVNRNGKAFIGQPAIDDDKYIPSLAKLANIIHQENSLAIMQIHHGGRQCTAATLLHKQPLSASAVKSLRPTAIEPRAMTNEEINTIIEDFGNATLRAIKAGFDGVEIHGANTYLIQQFFSPHSNQRTDQWGGNLTKRMAFPLAIVKKVSAIIKTHATKPFILGYRISPEEIEEPGITLEDTYELMDELIKFPLDYIHISLSYLWRKSMRNKTNPTPTISSILQRYQGKIPLIGVGGICTPEDALKGLENGLSLIAIGRQLIIDSQWLTKVAIGAEQTINTALNLANINELVIPQPLIDLFVEDGQNWKINIIDMPK